LLTRPDFESAIKDALRHYTQADLLAPNALIHASTLTRSEPGGATPQALRALLADTAKALFAGERDQRLYRVLEVTYFNPAPKQEAAAERLGLSFSTYRRHLTAGVDRLVEWLWQREQEAPRAETVAEQTTPSTSVSAEPGFAPRRPRLSIVILPFLNLSGDASLDYIVDGIVDSLITDLSTHVLGSFVISRSTAFAYKDRSVGTRQVGSELGVRYVLEGSVSADASHIGVNVQLIDAETDEHLWAERFDKERRDIRRVQEEIVGRLSRSVGLEMVRAEVARRDPNTNSSDAEDLTMRGRALVHDVKQKENAEEAIELFRRALELDSDYVDAMAGIALARVYQVINLYRLEERDALLDEAEHMVNRGLALSPDHFAILKARGLLLRARGRFSEALVASEALISRNPVEPTAYKEIGLNKLYLGETQEAVEWFRRADAIAPRDPDRWAWLQGLGRALMQLGHPSEAVTVLSQALDSNPGYVRGRAWLAAAEALAGDVGRAGLHLAEYAAMEPGITVRRFAEERSSVPLGAVSPVYRRESERILEGLRIAGMPDGSDACLARGPESILPEAGRGASYGNSGGLSQPFTKLIGREAELSEVVDLMRTHRLVTLIGEGGIGKTRLALEVARQLLPEFADGVRIAEFAPLFDPELVPVTVAKVLGLELSTSAMSAERVANALGGKPLLLVLDNCEHVIDAAAGMAETLLHTGAAIRVLATSREPLRTEGEYLYRVPPLAVPAEDTHDLEELLRHGAVLLFVTRARAADPHFSPDGRIGLVVAAICRRLDGIPLAIELAAARGAALGITEIASRLDNRFDLLTGGDRTALPRHQTLRATLDWSYELLPESERVVLRRLAIFAGGFTLAAARAVAGAAEITASDVVDHLANLVGKSLVALDIGGAPTRYRLLETPRAYALERLTRSGEIRSIAGRHADYYRDLLTAAAQEKTAGADRSASYGSEIDNVRAALVWAFGPEGDAAIAVPLAAVSAPVWLEMSLLSECSGWAGKALASLCAADRGTRHEMQLQTALGFSLMFTKGMTTEAHAALLRAVELAEGLGDPDYQLRNLFALCVFRLRLADFRGALELARRCETVAQDLNDAGARPAADWMLGLSLFCLGDLAGGRMHLERVCDGHRPASRRAEIVRFGFDQRVYALGILGIITWLQGFPDQAMRTSRRSIDEAQMLEHPVSLSVATWMGSMVSLWAGDLAAAERSTSSLIDHTKKHVLDNYHAYGQGFEGELAAARGNIGDGVRRLRACLEGLRKARHQVFYAVFVSKLAKVTAAAGNLGESFAMLDEAVRDVERSGESWYLPELLRIKGELLRSLDEPNTAGAEDHFSRSLALARRQGALSWELRTATSLSGLWRDRGRTREALELLAPIYDRFTEGFESADLRAAKTLIDQLRTNIPSGPRVARGANPAPSHPFTNLPEPISELIGRETELSEVADLIRRHRLVTLIGEGGIGKTRFGLEVARHLLPEFADGAWVVELASLSDPELVPGTIATALGLNLAAGAISAQHVADALGTKRLVLVLDNCEHLIDMAANMARRLVHTNPTMRVVATSREPLRTAGECLYRLPPLAVPDESIEDREELLRHGAVQLFVARARAANRHFSPDRPTAAVAAGICRRLDGIPLAIELAAARSAALGIDELASRLDDRFHMLAGGHRTAPPRQQTLRATLDWSYGLLPESERAVLRRLAIFVASFGLEAASIVAVSAEITGSAVIDCVANLVTKSLVAADAGDATERYRLLETTRAYALEKLTESGELASLALQHAQYYRDLFERASAEWLPDYKPRIANLRAALDWAFSPTGDASVGVALTVVAVPLWMRLSLVDECRGRVEHALSAVAHGENRNTPEEMQLYAALGASLLYTKGPAPETGAAWTNALEIAERLGDTGCQLRALRGLWAYHLNNGEYQAALTLAQRFSSLTAKQTDPADLLVGARMTGTATHYLGDQTDARRHIERALGGYAARPPPDRYQFDQRVTALATLARILWLQGFPDRAMRSALESVVSAQAGEDMLSLCNALVQAACPVALFVGDLASADRYIATLLDNSAKHGLALWHARARGFKGMLLNKTGDIAAGLRLLGAALGELRETRYSGHLMAFLGAFAEASGRVGQVAEGLVAIDQALARSERTEGRWCVAELLRIKGDLVLQELEPNPAEAAEELFLKALDLARQQGALSWELRVATSLSRLWRGGGRTKEALELLAPIYDRFTEGFGSADLIAAKALLDALEPSPSPERERGPTSQKWVGKGR
jgi:predicted ATPase/TolB-like protein/Tfp pilus assembly protein PilF